MQRWKNYLFNFTFFLNCLLLFLVLFENRLSLPAWLQVVGRMHPLVLHFPVVLVVGFALGNLAFPAKKLQRDETLKSILDSLLLLTAFSAVVTALAGLFLSREPGYDPEALMWHKWGGIVISFFTLSWYFFSRDISARKIPSLVTSVFAIVLIIFAGHQGAGITHGQNFLLAPMLPEKKRPVVSPEEAVVFNDLVKPILENKCESCHNSKKAKGGLIMESEALLLKGGKGGKLWDSTAADLGLMLRRIHLPLEARKHMPPQGKPQLTEEEIAIITGWIKKGADFKLRVAELPITDTLRQMANNILVNAEIAEYDFDEADPAEVQKLNTPNRVIRAEAVGSPALAVNFFNARLFNPEQLKELDPIKKQIVTLDLAKMPLKDEDMKGISGFENLRRLNLSFTGITGSSLGELKKLKHLKSLAVSGTKTSAAQLSELKNVPELSTIYAWNTGAGENEMEKLRQELKNIRIETGFHGDTVTMKLSPPVLVNEESIITGVTALKLKHYIQGASIRYTLDGTEPDSIHSPVYKGDETVNSTVNLKAKAFKPGWISSDLLEASFYKNTYTADSVIYLTKPNEKYKDEKGKLLINHEKGEADFRFGGWVAFRENRMEVVLSFAKAATVQTVTLSSLVDIGSYLMPPQHVEVWGGDDLKNLKLLGKINPEQPDKMKPSARKGFDIKFNSTTVKYLKVIGVPVPKLPSWHPGKGDKAWLFVDEILVN